MLNIISNPNAATPPPAVPTAPVHLRGPQGPRRRLRHQGRLLHRHTPRHPLRRHALLDPQPGRRAQPPWLRSGQRLCLCHTDGFDHPHVPTGQSALHVSRPLCLPSLPTLAASRPDPYLPVPMFSSRSRSATRFFPRPRRPTTWAPSPTEPATVTTATCPPSPVPMACPPVAMLASP